MIIRKNAPNGLKGQKHPAQGNALGYVLVAPSGRTWRVRGIFADNHIFFSAIAVRWRLHEMTVLVYEMAVFGGGNTIKKEEETFYKLKYN